MKTERKKVLLGQFPETPDKYMTEMKASCKRARMKNFAVLLTRGNELFVRCYHRYCNGELIERQRYVFAKDGCVRYGWEDWTGWEIRKDFREPLFCSKSYGYSFDNSYTVLNPEAIKKSCMKYSHAEEYRHTFLMEYMRLYIRHPNVEYLVKTGYAHLINEVQHGYWGGRSSLSVSPRVDLKSNDLLKMLKLNRMEFKLLRGHETRYEDYMNWRDRFPKYKPEELLLCAEVFRNEIGSADNFSCWTGLKPSRLARYLKENVIDRYDYRDYLDQCRELRYDLHDTAISMPRDFRTMHERFAERIEYKHTEDSRRSFKENYESRIELEYSFGNLLIRQPESIDEIIDEGAVLHHCVGGYAKRHAEGKLNILFIRKVSAPDKPFYTMEVDTSGHIKQVRGDHNRDMTKEVAALAEHYKAYLDEIFSSKKARKTA